MAGRRGQIGIGIVFLFFFGLALSSFAMDAGSIFMRKNQAQKILDNAVLDGVAKFKRGGTQAQVETLVAQLIQHQADQQKLTLTDVVVNASTGNLLASGVETRVQASANIKSPVVMFKFLNPSQSEWIIGVKAAARMFRKPVILSMVIDTTGSMGFNDKLKEAQAAAKRIVDDVLTNALDQMALISYADKAATRQSMCNVSANKNVIKTAINNLSAEGSTNIADGILYGKTEIVGTTVPVNPGPGAYRRLIILLTDGTPNTILATFTKPRSSLSGADKIFFGDEVFLWGNDTPTPGENYPQKIYDNGANMPLCQGGLDPNANVINECLENFTYTDSKRNAMGVLELQGLTITAAEAEFIGRAYADLAIREADYAKDWNSGMPEQQMTIYTVGVGLHHDPAIDPYEREINYDPNYLHGVILRKLANDPAADGDLKFDPAAVVSNYNPLQPSGQYFETSDPDNLFTIFSQIINSEPIRLTEPNP